MNKDYATRLPHMLKFFVVCGSQLGFSVYLRKF